MNSLRYRHDKDLIRYASTKTLHFLHLYNWDIQLTRKLYNDLILVIFYTTILPCCYNRKCQKIYLHALQRTFFTKEMKNTIISLIIPSILGLFKVYTGIHACALILFFNLHLNPHLTSLSLQLLFYTWWLSYWMCLMIAAIISTVLGIREIVFIISRTLSILLSFYYLEIQVFLKSRMKRVTLHG